MPILVPLFIIFFCTAVGRALIQLIFPASTETADPLSRSFASLAVGILINGWFALTLAEIGIFSVWWLALLNTAVITYALFKHGRTLWSPFLPSSLPPEQIMLIVWLTAASLLLFRPHHFILGAADAGVYVNLSSNLARTGQLTVTNQPLTLVDPDLYPALFRTRGPDAVDPYIWLPAFTFNKPDSVNPRFYHLATVWQAAGFQLADLDGALYITPFWGILGALAVYMTGRTLWPWPWAAAALWALTLTPFQLWFSRYHTTEPLTQFLMWLALWSFALWAKDDYVNKLWAFIAGFALGSTFLTRIDTFFLLPLPALLFLWLWGQQRLQKHHFWFFAPLTFTILHSIFHAWFYTRLYFTEIFSFIGRSIGSTPILAILAVILALLSLLAYLRWQAILLTLTLRYKTPLRIVAILLIIGWAIYNWFIRPPELTAEIYTLDSRTLGRILQGENLIRLSWYLSPLTIWAAVLGTCLMVWHINRRTWAILLLGLIFTPLLVFDARANAIQIYVMRRYLPVVVPFLIVAAVALWHTIAHLPQRWLRPIIWPLIIIWFGLFAWHGRVFATTVNFETLYEQTTTLSEQLPENAILLFNDPTTIGQGDILGTTISILHQRHTFKIYNEEALDPAALTTTLGRWQAIGYAVYWVDTPGGYAWPLPDRPLADPIHSYTLSYSALDERYDQPPSEIVTFELQGTIYPIPTIDP